MTNPSGKKLLRAVRVLMATAVAVVVLPAVDMPGTYMGARDELTTFGLAYSVSALVLAVVGAWGAYDDRKWSHFLTSLLLSVHVGFFLPGFASDPVLSGLVVVWQLVVLGVHLVGRSSSQWSGGVRGDRRRTEAIESWYDTWGAALQHTIITGVVLTVAVVGFGISGRPMALATCGAINVLALAAAGRFLWALLREGSWAVGLVVAAWVVFWLVGPSVDGVLVALAVSNSTVFSLLLVRSPLFEELLEYFFDFPALLVVSSFSFVILLGTLLLTLPVASPGPTSVSPVDALFTSTSATCVTGLIVLDTPHDFTFFGQAVIVALIQVGGLGIMVVSTFGALLLGEGLGLRGERALGDLMDVGGTRDAYYLTRFIVLTTLAFETVGAAVITSGYLERGYAVGEAIWHGVFHAISAFCNAGFALQSDSIVMFQEDPLMLGTFAGLVVFGGIGFVVLGTAWTWLSSDERPEFHMQTSVIVVATLFLLASGTLLYAACEWTASLGHLSVGDKITNAIYQSVTLRTAGFNSVGFGSLRSATAVFMMAYMFIGASPGSTAGGIKTTTVAVLLGAVRAIARGETRVVFFGRRVPQAVVYRSAAIASFALSVLAVGTFTLLLVEDIAFEETLFEAVSALGTVGLSLGATGELHAAGKLTVIAMMFLGRVGPLTLALLLGGTDRSDVGYPNEDVMVG